MKKTKQLRILLMTALVTLSGSVFAQVKIGTNPTQIETASNLEVEASTGQHKVKVDKTTGQLTIADGTQGSGKVLTSDANGGASWQSQGIVTAGDLKHSFLAADHSGWYLVDGRAVNTLPTNAQTAAAALGFSTVLPNAQDRFIKTKAGSEVLGSLGGQNSVVLVQANLPNVTFTGTTNTTGSHTHPMSGATIGFTDNSDGSGFQQGPNWNDQNIALGAAGNHAHTVSIPSGGSGTAVNTVPLYMVANTFVYLGQ